jgi:hypothetical protein
MSGQKPLQVCFWSGGWYLVGNGPAYLLFHAPKKEVTHLVTGMHRELREALKGYSAIQEAGNLALLVWALARASADAINLDSRTHDASECRRANYIVVREIERLRRQFPNRTNFEAGLRRLNSSLRAAGQYAMYYGAPGVPEGTSPPGSFFAHDQYGQRLLVTRTRVYRCEPDSSIARCALALWRREQAHWADQRTVLYRVPTRKELREYRCCDEATITKLCRREGFDWLPSAPKGRHKD